MTHQISESPIWISSMPFGNLKKTTGSYSLINRDVESNQNKLNRIKKSKESKNDCCCLLFIILVLIVLIGYMCLFVWIFYNLNISFTSASSSTTTTTQTPSVLNYTERLRQLSREFDRTKSFPDFASYWAWIRKHNQDHEKIRWFGRPSTFASWWGES